MCTVAFVPEPNGGYLLGHNRDESRARGRGEPPSRGVRDGRAFLSPRDPDGGGTWIGVNEAGVTMCVLNAAEPAERVLAETLRSRGLVLSSLLHLESVGDVERVVRAGLGELDAVRSFHLVVAEPGDASRSATAVAIVWNGTNLASESITGPEILVSSSRYLEEASIARGRSWSDLLAAEGPPDAGRLATWLASHEPVRGPLSVCMHREEAQTVCRTIVEVRGSNRRLFYHDGPPCEPGLDLEFEL